MKSWKAEEQRVASQFGQRRRPLSGNRQAGIGESDTMNLDGSRAELFVEVKSWGRMPLIKHINKVREQMQKEAKAHNEPEKPWLLCIHKKGSHERYAVVDLPWLAELWNENKRLKQVAP